MATELEIPAAPALLPPAEQKKWRAAYAGAFKQAQADYPDNEPAQHGAALREANRILRVDAPESYEDAIKIPDHLVLQRGTRIDEKTGKERLYLVTIDAKKHYFDVPPAKASKGKGKEAENPDSEKATA